jgi:hypothetical protein
LCEGLREGSFRRRVGCDWRWNGHSLAIEAEKNWRREREREKMGRKEKRVGPVTVINWDPHEFSPDLNLIELKNRSKGELKFGMRPHKIQVGISILT